MNKMKRKSLISHLWQELELKPRYISNSRHFYHPSLSNYNHQVRSGCRNFVTSSSTSSSIPVNDWSTVYANNHIPLTLSQRVFLASASSLLALVDTSRGDLIAALGETTGTPALLRLLKRLQSTTDGQRLLTDKPRITPDSIAQFSSLPPTTLGGAYSLFLSSHKFSPADRTIVRFVSDPEQAYVIQRYREVHDIWHVLTGCNVDVLGEIVQKWFELFETGLPMTLLSSLVGPIRLSLSEQLFLVKSGIPWAIHCSHNCRWLLDVYWEDLWERDIEELRKEMKIITAPTYPIS